MSKQFAKATNHDLLSADQLASATEEIDLGLRSTLRKLALPALEEIWEREVADLCGPRWHPAGHGRVARAGGCVVQVKLGGQAVSLRRPRVRGSSGKEIELRSCRMAMEQDLLDGPVLEAIVVGAATGYTPQVDSHHERLNEFTESLSNRLAEVIWQPIRELGPTLVVGDLGLRRFSALACVEIADSGERSLVALRAGSSESGKNVDGLLSQLKSRTAARVKPQLLLAGESRALQAALRDCFDNEVPVQRCTVEKTREVLALLPPAIQPIAMQQLNTAFRLGDAIRAAKELERIASDLEDDNADAASTLRNGLAETLTVLKLNFLAT